MSTQEDGLLEIVLTKELKIKVNVTFTGTITVPDWMDVDDFENDIEYTASLNGWRHSDVMEIHLREVNADVDINEEVSA